MSDVRNGSLSQPLTLTGTLSSPEPLRGELADPDKLNGTLDGQLFRDTHYVDDIARDISDAIREKDHTSEPILLPDMADRIRALEVEDDYEWRKPEDWPDLESIELPGSWEESTVYFLYDRKCGNDDVKLHGSYNMKVYKGTVLNGTFVGGLVQSRVGGEFSDILTDEYTVYKIVQSESEQIRFSTSTRITSSYPIMDQGCVWIYGEVPTFDSIVGNPSASMVTYHLRRMYLMHVTKMYPTVPSDIEDILQSVSYVCGHTEPNDWGNLPVNRTGNGAVTLPTRQKSDYVVKNVNFQQTVTGARILARNVVLVTPSGTFKNQQYQDSRLIEKFIVQGGSLKCSSMYYQFEGARLLHTVDMSDVDFSECTNWANAFNSCFRLRNLKLNSGCRYSLDLRQSPLLTVESMINLFKDLPIIDTSQKIMLNPYAKYKLTPEEIAIATQKGWTVA